MRDLIPRAKLVVIPGEISAQWLAPEKWADEVLNSIGEQRVD
ncbi:hypothetical protein ACFLUZ_03410 [Chloroflexota bacterium]